MKCFFYIFFVISLLTGCEKTKIILNDGLEEADAIEIVVFLHSNGIKAEKIRNENAPENSPPWMIGVKGSQESRALMLLRNNGYPKKRGGTLLDIFPGGGLIPSEVGEKVRLKEGLYKKIASMIENIDGIISAKVQVAEPEVNEIGEGGKAKMTAAVIVKHQGVLDDPNSHLDYKIKHLVANSISDLSFDDVVVIPVLSKASEGMDLSFNNAADYKEYVYVFGMTISKDSVFLFRIIFFSFLLFILLLFSFVLFFLWKLWPVLASLGGFFAIFSLSQVTMETKKGDPKGDSKASDENVPGNAEDKEEEERKESEGEEEDDDEEDDDEEDED